MKLYSFRYNNSLHSNEIHIPVLPLFTVFLAVDQGKRLYTDSRDSIDMELLYFFTGITQYLLCDTLKRGTIGCNYEDDLKSLFL